MTRSASDSLRGYSYQFHESVIRLLAVARDSDSITLEGIEDIDAESEYIQVKYLSSKKLTPSAIKNPATLMLKDYVENWPQRQDTTYTIYAYFGNDSGNADFLAGDSFYGECSQSLVEDRKNSITTIDAAIQNEFKNKLNLEVGESFEDKEKSVQRKLKEALGGEEKETSLYFYPNAMNLILAFPLKKMKRIDLFQKRNF